MSNSDQQYSTSLQSMQNKHTRLKKRTQETMHWVYSMARQDLQDLSQHEFTAFMNSNLQNWMQQREPSQSKGLIPQLRSSPSIPKLEADNIHEKGFENRYQLNHVSQHNSRHHIAIDQNIIIQQQQPQKAVGPKCYQIVFQKLKVMDSLLKDLGRKTDPEHNFQRNTLPSNQLIPEIHESGYKIPHPSDTSIRLEQIRP